MEIYFLGLWPWDIDDDGYIYIYIEPRWSILLINWLVVSNIGLKNHSEMMNIFIFGENHQPVKDFDELRSRTYWEKHTTADTFLFLVKIGVLLTWSCIYPRSKPHESTPTVFPRFSQYWMNGTSFCYSYNFPYISYFI